ncbi:MAG TPA: hypothetical protein VF214_07700, partial [Edaphobacter sp.]
MINAIVLVTDGAFSIWSTATYQFVFPRRQVLALGGILSADGTDLLSDNETWRKAETLVRESDRTTVLVMLAGPGKDACLREAVPHRASCLMQ